MTEIVLTEYQSQSFPHDDISSELAQTIWNKWRKYIDIEMPSFQNGQCWKITARGYVGILPISSDFAIRIQPKTNIHSVIKMLDWTEDFHALQLFKQLANFDTIESFCDYLANHLAKLILCRSKQGLFSSYYPEVSYLSYVRGRIDWRDAARNPLETKLCCHYSCHSIDIPDNQILRWTLYQLRHIQSLFKENTQISLRSAYRALSGSISLRKFSAQDCYNRPYHRLNQDYQILHSLCGFFLDNLHPGHLFGSHQALSFIIDTAKLYEKFVYGWLKANLPENYILKAQDPYSFTKNINCRIDLVLYDASTQKAIAVLDTKYKIPDQPSNDDIFQILAYAHFKQVKKAYLIYPEKLKFSLDKFSEGIHIQTLDFSLSTLSNTGGERFLKNLLS